MYQRNGVVGYIMIKLKKKGMDVRLIPPGGVLISWQRLVAGDRALPEPEGKVVRYELDEIGTQATPPYQMATAAERLVHKPCKGDCCIDRKPARVTRRKRFDMERRRDQNEIDRLIKERG